MNKTKSIFIIIFLLLSTFTYAQNPSYFKLAEEKFSNINVYTLLYDNKTDILYTGTNKGIFEYKQNEFVNMTTSEERIGSAFFNIKQNKKGELFCSNLSGQIFKLEKNNKWELFYETKSKKTGSNFKFYFVDNKLMVTSFFSIITIDNKGKFLEDLLKNNISIDGEINKIEKVLTSVKVDDRIFFNVVLKNKQRIIVAFKNNSLEHIETQIDQYTKTNSYLTNFIQLKKHLYSIDQFGNVLPITNSKINNFKKENKERIISLDNETTIGMSSTSGFRYFILKNNALDVSNKYLDNIFLSTVCITANKTIILGTFGEGIIVIPNKNIEKKEFKSLLLDVVSSPTNEVTISSRAGEIFNLKNGKWTLKDKVNHNVDNLFYFDKPVKLNKSKIKNVYYDNKIGLLTGAKDLLIIDENNILKSTAQGLKLIQFSTFDSTLYSFKNTQYNKNSLKYTLSTIVPNERITAIEWSKKDSLFYYITLNVFYYRAWSSSKSKQLLYDEKPFNGNDLLMYQDTLICSSKVGLLFFYNNKFVKRISEKEGLKSKKIKKIQIRNKRLFILTSKGIQVYDLNRKEFLYLGKSDGVECKQVTNFYLSNDKIWLLENHSCYSIDFKNIDKNKKVSKLYFTSVEVEGKEIDFNKKINFKYNQNPYVFKFDYRNIGTKREVKLYYKLEGLEQDWHIIPTSQNEVTYNYLPKGNYIFYIKAKFRGQETSVLTYDFKILPPFWQRWWFYVLIVFIIGGIISIIAFFRLKYLKVQNDLKLKQKDIEKEIIDSKLKAIKAQMNPHFIYNSINSIQNLILEKEVLKSYDYLVLFSKLVRNTIENSDNEQIYLKEEIEFLKVYLELEKLRFKEDFNYEINSNIQNNIKIPTLIIQPFLENAIKYGLLHKVGDKELMIDFELKKELKCTISDNGIGRKKAKEIRERKQNDFQTFSKIAIDMRLKIIKEVLKIKINYEVIDLYNENDEALGTKIILTIPLLTK